MTQRTQLFDRIIAGFFVGAALTAVGALIYMVASMIVNPPANWRPRAATPPTQASITVPLDGFRIKLSYKSPEGIEKELDAYIAIPGYTFKIQSVPAKELN